MWFKKVISPSCTSGTLRCRCRLIYYLFYFKLKTNPVFLGVIFSVRDRTIILSPFAITFYSPIQIIYTSNTTNATSRAGNYLPFQSISLHPRFLVGFVLLGHQFFVRCVVDCCLLFFELRILITILVSSNSPYSHFRSSNDKYMLNPHSEMVGYIVLSIHRTSNCIYR